MSCLPTQSKEPIFDPVTLLRPIRRSILNPSPKLRLSIDRNSLMTDADFEEIMSKERSCSRDPHDNAMATPLRFQCSEARAMTEPRPGVSPGDDDTAAIQPSTPLQSRRYRSSSEQVTSSVGDTDWSTGRNRKAESSAAANAGGASSPSPVPAHDPRATKQVSERKLPRASSVVPRVGTITALPGSTMIESPEDEWVEACESVSGGIVDEFASLTDSLLTASDAGRAMPPPCIPLPRAVSARPSVSYLGRPTGTAPTHPGRLDERASVLTDSVDSPPVRKRRLSFSSPIGSINLKRIFTPYKKQKTSPNITHTTHEATAGNRGTLVSGTNPGNLRVIRSPEIATRADTPRPEPQQQLRSRAFKGKAPTIGENTMNMDDVARSLPTTPAGTPSTRPSRILSFTRGLTRRSATPDPGADTPTTTTTEPAPTTSKSALHRTVIQLRAQVSDLGLENSILRDQISIVRQDWHDTARELDLERMRSWEMEMELFRARVRLEEMVAENKRLKRGSVVE